MLSKEPLFVEGLKTMPSKSRAKGLWSTERWIYGQLLGDKFIVGEVTNNRNGLEYKAKYEFEPSQICRCTGVVFTCQQDGYLYENDVIQNHHGQLLVIEEKNNKWIARVVDDVDEDLSYLDEEYDLQNYLHSLDNNEGSAKYVGNIVENAELRAIVLKNKGKRQKVADLLTYLREKSTSANVIPVFVDEDGEENYIDGPAIEVLNQILEQAYLPFIARAAIEGGWEKVTKDV